MMGILSRMESRATSGTLGPPRDPVVAAWFGGMPNSATGLTITATSAMRSTVVNRCVGLLSQTYAALPKRVYEEQDNGNKRLAKEHPRYKLIRRRPNHYQTSFEWFEMMAGHFALRNRAYSEIISTGGNAIDQLIPLHPDRVRPFHAPDGRLAFDYSPVSGPSRVILQSEMHFLHGMVMNSDGVTPLSPVAACGEAIGLALAAEEHTARLFGNGTRLGGVLKFPAGKTLKDDPTRKKLLDSWRTAQSGLRNVGKTAILEDGLEWQELGMTSMDAQLVELRNLQAVELCRIWGVPPHKVAELSRCMPADTLVCSKSGPKRIADVKPGDEVWCPSPQGVKLSCVLNNWYNGVRDILLIRTTNRTVRCTANHRLLVRRAHERPLNPGEIGGRNVGGEKKRVFWRDEYVQASELKTGDTLVTLDRLPEDGITVAPSGRNLTVGFMEFSGLLVSDGNITYENGPNCARRQSELHGAVSPDDAYRVCSIPRQWSRRFRLDNGTCDSSGIAAADSVFIGGRRAGIVRSGVSWHGLYKTRTGLGVRNDGGTTACVPTRLFRRRWNCGPERAHHFLLCKQCAVG